MKPACISTLGASCSADEQVELTFDNSDLMMHNFVLLQPGFRMEIVEAANVLGAKGPELHYVPYSDKVLASTPVVMPKKKAVVKFKASMKEGEYPYVCTFPGHGYVMHGILYGKETPKGLFSKTRTTKGFSKRAR